MNHSKSNFSTDREGINQMFDALDEYLLCHDEIDTNFGPAKTENGYVISEINVLPNMINLTVYMKDRSIRENDKWGVRGGDMAYFHYDRTTGVLCTQEEWEEKCRVQEEEWEREEHEKDL